MPTRDQVPNGAPCWIELSTTDVDKSRRFYEALFDWKSEDPNPDFGGYFMFTRDGVNMAGGMQTPEGAPPNVWGTYLAIEDVDQTVADAKANGGAEFAPVMDVADIGRMAWIGDKSGLGIGLWQPLLHKGFLVHGEPGTPCWFAVNATDYDGSRDFLTKVFGWQLAEAPEAPLPACVATFEGEQLASIQDMADKLPEGVPPHIAVFFGAEDTPATVEKAVSLGATVVMPSDQTPWGRLAGLADPTGALFHLVDGVQA